MLKKFTAALAVFALFFLFACSSDDEPDERKRVESNSSSSLEDGGNSSSDGESNPSSSSYDMKIVPKDIYNTKTESIFGTYAYSYTMTAMNTKEDLTQFWNCSATRQNDPPDPTCTNTELKATNALLQNDLTTQHSALHYIVDGFRVGQGSAFRLKGYKLKETGSQVALGLNVYTGDEDEDIKNIGQIGPTIIDNAESFLYVYSNDVGSELGGGSHVFRAVVGKGDEGNFWFFKVPKGTISRDTVKIDFKDFQSAGNLATPDNEGTPFDLSQVTQFLWVVEYEAGKPEHNENTLTISYFRAYVKE
jgi:hypothetical protein